MQRAAPGQQGGISLEDGRLLYGIVRALRPEYVIEAGVAAGVSNAFLNAALTKNGREQLFSIELPSERQGRLQQDGVIFDWSVRGGRLGCSCGNPKSDRLRESGHATVS